MRKISLAVAKMGIDDPEKMGAPGSGLGNQNFSCCLAGLPGLLNVLDQIAWPTSAVPSSVHGNNVGRTLVLG